MDDDSGAPLTPTTNPGTLTVTRDRADRPPRTPTPTPTPTPEPARPTVRVGTTSVDVGNTSRVQASLSAAPVGLSGFELTVTLRKPGLARFVGASYPSQFALTNTTITDSNANIQLKAADLQDKIQPGAKAITLGLIEIEGIRPGETRLDLAVEQMDDDVGGKIGPVTQSGRLTVAGRPVPNIIVTNVTLSDRDVIVNRTVTVSATLVNTGAASGDYNVSFTVDGIVRAFRSGRLASFGETRVSFPISFSQPGLHRIAIGNSTMNVRVQEATGPFVTEIRLSRTNVTVNEPVTVTGVIENPQNRTGSITVTLQVDGEPITNRTIQIDAGGTKRVVFETSFTTPGIHTITLNGVSPVEIRVRNQSPVPGIVGPPPTDPDNDGVFEDANGDGIVTIADVQTVFANRNSDVIQTHPARFDYNGDGSFTIADIQALFRAIQDRDLIPGPVGPPPTDPDEDGVFEDVNGDGRTSIADVQALFVNRNKPVIEENPERFDFNGDGRFNIVDVQALLGELTSATA